MKKSKVIGDAKEQVRDAVSCTVTKAHAWASAYLVSAHCMLCHGVLISASNAVSEPAV